MFVFLNIRLAWVIKRSTKLQIHLIGWNSYPCSEYSNLVNVLLIRWYIIIRFICPIVLLLTLWQNLLCSLSFLKLVLFQTNQPLGPNETMRKENVILLRSTGLQFILLRTKQ